MAQDALPVLTPEMRAQQAYSDAITQIEGQVARIFAEAEDMGLGSRPGHPDALPAIRAELHTLFETARAHGDTSAATGINPFVSLQTQVDAVLKAHQANGDLPVSSPDGIGKATLQLQTQIDAAIVRHEPPPPPDPNVVAAQKFSAGITDIEARVDHAIAFAEDAGLGLKSGQPDALVDLKAELHSLFETTRAHGDTSAATGVDSFVALQKQVDSLLHLHEQIGDLPAGDVNGTSQQRLMHQFEAQIDAAIAVHEPPPPQVVAAQKFSAGITDIEARVDHAIASAEDAGLGRATGHPDPLVGLKAELHSLLETTRTHGDTSAATGADPFVALQKQVDSLLNIHGEIGDLPTSDAHGTAQQALMHQFSAEIDAAIAQHQAPPGASAAVPMDGAHPIGNVVGAAVGAEGLAHAEPPALPPPDPAHDVIVHPVDPPLH